MWLCASAGIGLVVPVLLLILRRSTPPLLAKTFPILWIFLFIAVLVWVGLGGTAVALPLIARGTHNSSSADLGRWFPCLSVCLWVGRLLLNVPYLSVLFGVVFSVPGIFAFWFAGRLWPVYAYRNAYILAGWDPVTFHTTRSCWGLISRLCALVRLALLAASALLTVNSIAGLVSGRVVGYLDTWLMLQIPAEAYYLRYLVWVVLRVGPLAWLVVQPSAFIEMILSQETYHLLNTVDYEDVLSRAERLRDTFLDKQPFTQLGMFNLVLYLLQVLLYVVVLVCCEILWIGSHPVNGYLSTTQLSILQVTGLDQASYIMRYNTVGRA